MHGGQAGLMVIITAGEIRQQITDLKMKTAYFPHTWRGFKPFECEEISFLFTHWHVKDQTMFPTGKSQTYADRVFFYFIRSVQVHHFFFDYRLFRNIITCPRGYVTMDLKLGYDSLNDLKDFKRKMRIGLCRSWNTIRKGGLQKKEKNYGWIASLLHHVQVPFLGRGPDRVIS